MLKFEKPDAARFTQMMDLKGFTKREIAKILGISTVSLWKIRKGPLAPMPEPLPKGFTPLDRARIRSKVNQGQDLWGIAQALEITLSQAAYVFPSKVSTAPTTPVGATWKAVKGYEGLYEVSDAGTVRSVPRVVGGRTHEGKQLTPTGNQCLKVVLCVDGAREEEYVHTLVLEAFVGRRPRNHVARHIDGNRFNLRLDNLKWVKINKAR